MAINIKTTKQLHEQNIKNVITNNRNVNIDWPYYICNLCKIIEEGNKSYKRIDILFIPVILIVISYQEKVQQISKVSILVIQSSQTFLLIFTFTYWLRVWSKILQDFSMYLLLLILEQWNNYMSKMVRTLL